MSSYKGVQERFEPYTSKIQDVCLTTRTTIIYFRFYIFPFHIQIIEETTIENRVHKTMVLSPWIVHVISKNVCTKTMASNTWFCACHKHEKRYKNPNRACVKGGSICDITNATIINILFFFIFLFIFSQVTIHDLLKCNSVSSTQRLHRRLSIS